MSEFLFRTAMEECKQELRKAIGEIPIVEPDLDSFAQLFVADFSELLSNQRGEAIWRRDGARVRRLGRYLGTLAQFYAVASGEDQPVSRHHLMKALQVIQPDCKLRVVPEGAERQDYCRHVIINTD